MKTMQPWPMRVVIACCVFAACLAAGGSQPGAMVVWGSVWNGSFHVPATVPAELTNLVAAAAGNGHSVVLKSDRTVAAWGNNIHGQADVPSGLSNVVAIAAGGDHSVALQSNGTVVAWGYDYYDQATVPPGLSNVIAIAAGGAHTLGVRSNRRVVAWGYNNSGQTNVPPGLSNVVAVAAGQFHSLALRSNGTVVAWGDNYNGQTNVPPGLTNVVAIAAGADFSLALRSDGTVQPWGKYFNGSAYVQMTPPEGLSEVVAIAGGSDYGLALQAKGTAVAWGTYFNGTAYVPMTAPVGLSNLVAVAAGYNHSLAIAVGPEPMTLWPPLGPISLAPQGTTNLTVAVSSGSPYTCQWSSNGVPLVGATNTTLLITNFSLANAGYYSILVTNQGSSATTGIVVRLANSPVVLVDGVDVGGGKVSRIDAAVQITMSSAFGPDAEIYYTLDGSEPWFDGIPYRGAFTLTNSAILRAIAFNGSYTDWAEAAPIDVEILPIFTLLAGTAGGGSISVSPAPYSGTNRYVSGTNVTLTATPNDGWSFVRWTGDSTATTNVITLAMDANRDVQALFGTSLNLFTNGSGRILLDPPAGPYLYGANVRLSALPDTNYYFFGWAGVVSGFNNPLCIQATNASGITARFAPLHNNQVSLTVQLSGNGAVTSDPFKNVYTNGETVTLTASTDRTNVFKGWSGDASGTANPLALLLDANKLLTANFVPGTNPPVITKQPLSRTLGVGESTLLSFALTGEGPFSYQWRFNGSPLSGATNATLMLTNVTAADAGLYAVEVIDPVGTAISSNASVALFGLETFEFGPSIFPLLILNGAAGTSYRLEYSDRLPPTNWNLLGPVTLDEDELYYVDDPVEDHSRRFYRAVPE